MRMHLRSTVAIAALALATPSFGQGPGTEPGPGRQQDRSIIERPNAERPGGNAGGAERGLERAQERQERAQERQIERQLERNAQPSRSSDDKPDGPRPPRAAEPAKPGAPSAPDRRNAESDRPSPEGRGNENRPVSPRNPRAAEPAIPAQPPQPQRDAQPTRPGDGRIEPARPRAAEPASPATPAPAQREAQPTNPRSPSSAPSTAQPSPAATPQQPDSTAARSPATPDQQRAINQTIEQQIERREVRQTRDVGVSISVGASLPERVRIERLPREIVDLRPQYRDYGIVVTERETVIVDPRTRRVVEVIDRRGGGSPDRMLVERIERGAVREWRNPRVEIREDVILPADAPLVELPSEYVESMPRYRGYRYVASGDEIAIVEPRSRRVVQVIERKPSRNAEAPATTASTGRAALSPEDREEINRLLLQRAAPGSLHGMRDLRGSTLPSSLELQRLPGSIAERSPSLKDMSYVLIGDDALIVDPENRRVIDVIE